MAEPVCSIDTTRSYLDHLERHGTDLRAHAVERVETVLLVDASVADEVGSLAMIELATERGLAVRVVGRSEHHSGVTFMPRKAVALAAATGTAKTAKPVECEASQSGGEAVTPNPCQATIRGETK